jgi:hypothetical protein
MASLQNDGAGDQASDADLVAAGHAAWTGHSQHGLDRSTLYGRLQYSMDALSYRDYGSLAGLITASWIVCGAIIYVILFQPLS